jgi:hypothetical protein
VQSVFTVHWTQFLLPSHLMPPDEHGVFSGAAGFDGVPEVHTSSVQALPSTGTSESKLTVSTAPEPLHWFCLQSPAVWLLTGVPAAVFVEPQVSLVQAKVLHSVVVPQSLAARHFAHVPEPLHLIPPPSLHAVPAASGGCEGVPLTQMSPVHSLPSSG